MPYTARKTMLLGGQEVARGTVVSQEIIDAIPEYRFGALVRTGLLEPVAERNPQPQVDVEPEPQPEPVACPICGDGPFVRLAQHVAKAHQVTMADIAEVPLAEGGESAGE